MSDHRPGPAHAPERPWPHGEPAAARRAGRPHRRRAGRGRRLGHRAREQRQHVHHLAGHRERPARSATSTVPSPTPRRPRRARPAPTTGAPSATTDGAPEDADRLRPALRPRRHGGANGGATSSGVTGGAINVVYYQPQPGGLAATISGAAGTNAQALATAQAYVAMFNQVYELYGRHVNLIPFTASGADSDPVAAHADAVTVAQQLHAFASINGPGETTAYEDELARLHVLCLACGDSSTNGQIQQNAPFQWANLPTADTSLHETVDYIVAKLNGKDAVWAGDPALHTQKRKFIVVSETSEPPAPGSPS